MPDKENLCMFCMQKVKGDFVELFRHQFKEHKCYICEHSYFRYGCELDCELKTCKFKFKKKG